MLTQISRLAFGRARPDGRDVTDAQWADFEAARITASFPDGYTILAAEGGWKDCATGMTIREASTILEVAHDGGEEALRAIRSVATAYKIIFNQDAVMVTTVPAQVEFI